MAWATASRTTPRSVTNCEAEEILLVEESFARLLFVMVMGELADERSTGGSARWAKIFSTDRKLSRSMDESSRNSKCAESFHATCVSNALRLASRHSRGPGSGVMFGTGPTLGGLLRDGLASGSVWG